MSFCVEIVLKCYLRAPVLMIFVMCKKRGARDRHSVTGMDRILSFFIVAIAVAWTSSSTKLVVSFHLISELARTCSWGHTWLYLATETVQNFTCLPAEILYSTPHASINSIVQKS